MKKTITLLIAAAAMATTGVAQNYRLAERGAELPSFRELQKTAGLQKAPNKEAGAESGIITEAPEGETKTYTLNACSFYVAMGSYIGFEEVSTARDAVWTEDAVYLQGPLGAYDQGTYMKAEKRDDSTYVVKLPCPIYTETYMDWQTNEQVIVDYELRLMDGVRDENGEITKYAPTDETEVVLAYEDGVLTLDLDYEPVYLSDGSLATPEKILGVCVTSNGNWAGYGDARFEWEPFDEVVATPPADMRVEDWVLSTNGLGRMIRLGFKDDEVWIGDLNTSYIPDSWVKGEIKGDKVVVESGQYMGVIAGQFVYFMSATFDKDYKTTVVDKYEFEYDAEAKSIKASNPNMEIGISAYKDRFVDWQKWVNPTFAYQPENVDPTPLNPFNLEFAEWFADYGYNTFSYEESNINANGHLLDTENMYYRLFFDEELVEFGVGDYEDHYDADFPEGCTDIPFNYNGANFWTWDITHQIQLWVEGMTTIGVQVLSIVDGKEYSSDIVTLDVETNDVTIGVEKIGEEAGVAEVTYYDLNGRRVANLGKGIYVCKAIMNDGTVKSYKVAVR